MIHPTAMAIRLKIFLLQNLVRADIFYQVLWGFARLIGGLAFAAFGSKASPQNLSGFAANFNNFKFFYELIITQYSKFFKKNEFEKFTALAANYLALLPQVVQNL
jgi:hypothetical protein